MLPHILDCGRMISAPTWQVLVKNTIVPDVAYSAALREDEETDENGAFANEDSTEVRRMSKGSEKRQ